MKASTFYWAALFVAGGAVLLARAMSDSGMAKVYVTPVRMAPESEGDTRTKWIAAEPDAQGAVLSLPRTAGVWIAAFFTLAIFSFLYRDNPFYRFAEAVMVGVGAGWAMVVGFWEGIVAKLLASLAPNVVRRWAMPDIAEEQNFLYLVPLVLSIMLLWRLAPRGGWIGRWPLAFIVGTFAGLRLISFLDAEFVSQIRNTLVPLVVITNGGFDFWASLRNTGLVAGVLSCLTYFFFSVEHRGLAGRVSRVGIWFLMITFGASFAFTVMGRIALLASRLEFLFYGWLSLKSPLFPF